MDNPNERKGFAQTPRILQGAGPQMEDYKDWDSWYYARQMWVLERMLRMRAGSPLESGQTQ